MELEAPTLKSPENGTFINDSTPTFEWENTYVADNYELWVDDDPTFPSEASAKVLENTTDNYRTITTALDDGTYYWRVRAYNGEIISDFSDIWTLTIDTTEPNTTLTEYSPDPTTDKTPRYYGTATDATTNIVDIEYRINGGSWIDVDPFTSSKSVSFTFATSTLAYGDYTFETRAKDEAGNWETTYASDNLIIAAPTVPPPPGMPVSRVDEIEPYWQVSTPFTITATALDPNGSVESVELWYRYSSDNEDWIAWTSGGTDISSPWEWSFDAPAGDGFYEFYSVATDDDGNVEDDPDEADARCGVDTIAPPTPELITPLDKARMEDNTPTFDWSDVTDPSGVTYELTIEIYGSSVLTKAGLVVSAYTLEAGEALPEGTYNWHVRAVDGAGNAGDWSAARSFTIEIIAPPTVVIPEILAGETQTADFTLYNVFLLRVTVTAAQDISDAQILIRETKERPALVSEPRGIVYFFYAIIETNIEPSDISSVTIQFQLPRSWIESSEVDENTIKLLKYSSDWDNLPTTPIGGDEDYLYFEASMEEFSVFAATGEKRAPLPPPVVPPAVPILFYALLSLGVALGGSTLAYRFYRLKRPPKVIRKPYLMLKRLEEAVVRPKKRRIKKPLAKPKIERPPKPLRKPYLMLKELEEAVGKPRERRVRKPLAKPKITSFLINRGAKTTSSCKVTLSIAVSEGVSDVVQMQFSNDKRSWSAWGPFSKSKAYTMPAGDGLKKIYARVKDKEGLISPVASASIKLRVRRVARPRVPTHVGYSIDELRRLEAKLRRY